MIRYLYSSEPFLKPIQKIFDDRGSLRTLLNPFPDSNVIRIFQITDVPRGGIRGRHAHKMCSQAMFIAGSPILIRSFNIKGNNDITLTQNFMLIVPPWNWIEIEFPMEDTVLTVIADQPYDKADYIYELP